MSNKNGKSGWPVSEEGLDKILYLHGQWLIKQPGGVRANLSHANLSGKKLPYAHLGGADLSFANLFEADLEYADLRNANLWGADLSGANLGGSMLWGANLTGADLQNANLWCAELGKVDLREANIDCSAWPLHCGSLDVKIDKKIFCQLLYHVIRAGLSVKDADVRDFCNMPEVIAMANQFKKVGKEVKPIKSKEER